MKRSLFTITITQILILFPKTPLFTANVSKDRLKNYEREGKVLFLKKEK